MASQLWQRVRWVRARTKLSQEAFGARLGVTKSAVSQWESADPDKRTEPTLDKLQLMTAHWSVRIAWLLDDESDLPSPSDPRADAATTPPDQGVAHGLSYIAITLPRLISWEDVMSSDALPAQFVVAMPDDALSPRIARGTELIFEVYREPIIGHGVLVQDNSGRRYIRRYAEGRAGGWVGQAVNSAYATLESERDGLRVLAVMTGQRNGAI